MPTLTNDQIGRFAELLAAVALSRPVKGPFYRPLFRATPLGEKYPTVDFLVDVLDANDASRGFFFAQVKGTTSASSASTRLPAETPRDRFNRLVRVPAPSYVIGVDVVSELAYIMAAHRIRKSDLSSIPKAYCLRDDDVRIRLYREVLAFWKANRPLRQRTEFPDV